MSQTRRSFLGTCATAGIVLLDPNIVLGADRTLTIALPNNPTTLDPMQISNHDAMAVTNMVFENLLEVDLEGHVGPSLARAMPEVSDDQTVFRFDLRDDVRQFFGGWRDEAAVGRFRGRFGYYHLGSGNLHLANRHVVCAQRRSSPLCGYGNNIPAH